MTIQSRNYHALTLDVILTWADHHHAAKGAWPVADSGSVLANLNERWVNLDQCLRKGLRGLPGGDSLACLLIRERGVQPRYRPPPVTEEQILAWADQHRQRTGAWPCKSSGPVLDQPGEVWQNLDAVLIRGGRGLPGGSSLAQLLATHRGARNRSRLPPLLVDAILRWADQHREQTGCFPTCQSGAVGTDGETWNAIDQALRRGLRGLPGGSSLARLLSERRGKRNHLALPQLTEEGIVAWAKAFKRRRRRYPTKNDGAVREAPGENWGAIDIALKAGARGLPGGSTLARLLAKEFGLQTQRPALTSAVILRWADAHKKRTGKWPTVKSGPVTEAPGETWSAIDHALRAGLRGLPYGSSLICLLAEARQASHRLHPGSLKVSEVLAWADAHHREKGVLPNPSSGPVTPGSSVTWGVVNECLRHGHRGLPAGTTLFRFLVKHGRIPSP